MTKRISASAVVLAEVVEMSPGGSLRRMRGSGGHGQGTGADLEASVLRGRDR